MEDLDLTPTGEFNAKQSDKIVIGDENVSLQDSFQKFRDRKIKERHILKMCNGGLGNSQGRSEDQKSRLRERFVNKAKEYLGVPYAEKYKPEGAPTAPLYLDCCGLVRQVVVDLQEEFGFLIGRWNQAYQIDTLPVILKKEDLKPGDLIFYEGIYNNPNARPQKHNMVHVEIYLGGETGDATIGARFQRGTVSIFPSYKFKSTTWELVQYHYRSIDTWLDGECKSHCCEHPWVSDAWKSALATGKRSIFHDNDDDIDAGGEDEQGGGDGDEDDLGGNEDASRSQQQRTSAFSRLTSSENVENTNMSNQLNRLSPSKAESIMVISGQVVPEISLINEPTTLSMAIGGSSMTLESKDGVIAEQKLQRRLKTTSPLKGQKTSSFNNSLNNNSNSNSVPIVGTAKPKRTTGVRATINALNVSSNDDKSGDEDKSADESGPSDLPKNGSKVSEKLKSSAPSPAKRRELRRDLSASLDSLPISSLKTEKESASSAAVAAVAKKNPVPNTYYVGKSNGWKLVKDALDKRGWQQLPFEYQFSSRFNLKWVERRSQIDYRAHQPGQLVSHIPNNDCITSKTGLYSTLKEYYTNISGNSAKVISSADIPWVCETYRLDIPADVAAFHKAEEEYSKEDRSLWIYKPACFNRGRGIRVVEGKAIIDEIINGVDTGDADTTIPPARGIMQRYLTDPLLIGPEGYKFDIRVYFLIARNFPTTLAFYHPGYCRLTLKPFTISKESLDDPTIHLTNAAIQKKDSLYKENKEKQIQLPSALADTLDECGLHDNAEFMRNGLDHQIKLCLTDVALASNSKLLKKHGYFDLLGCDFMVTTSNKLILIEINSNPALSLDNSTLEQLLPGVVDSTIEIVLSSQGPDRPSRRKDDSSLISALPGKFELIYDEASGFQYK